MPESGRWQLLQNCLRIGCQISAWNWVESAGNSLLAPTACEGGGVSVMPVLAADPAPIQFLIQVSMVSAQAFGSATQQLWPPPTLRTRV
ncbi:MAG: hypothetical protein E6K49_05375, partial [Gammaproteobacteria bacterium]